MSTSEVFLFPVQGKLSQLQDCTRKLAQVVEDLVVSWKIFWCFTSSRKFLNPILQQEQQCNESMLRGFLMLSILF